MMMILFRILAVLCVGVVAWLWSADFPKDVLVTMAALFGAAAATCWLMPLLAALKTQKQQSARTAEKLEVSAENSGEKVKALEAKIKTLEKALDEALSK